MNPILVKSIYSDFCKGERKVFTRKPKMQYDEIVQYLQSRGWSGTLTRTKESGLIKTIEEIEI